MVAEVCEGEKPHAFNLVDVERCWILALDYSDLSSDQLVSRRAGHYASPSAALVPHIARGSPRTVA